MDATPFGTPHLTSTPRIPNTEAARFVNLRRNARGGKFSFSPNMDAIQKRVEEERRKKKTYAKQLLEPVRKLQKYEPKFG
jgi:hypothetical protein